MLGPASADRHGDMQPTRNSDAHEIAAMAALRRLSFGAAHSLNNAFTSALGEASFLLEERKDDAELVECCQLIVDALERSTRITRGILARRSSATHDAECDLVALVRELDVLLRETLGSTHEFSLATSETWLATPAQKADIELVLMTLLQYATDSSGQYAKVHGQLERSDADARLTVRVTAEGLPEGTAEAINDPTLASDGLAWLCLRSVREIVGELGGELHAEQTAPDSWALILRLPAVS